MNDQPANPHLSMPAMPGDDTVPQAPIPVAQSNDSVGPNTQNLEDQNIFELLGITEASAQEQEEFLDQLQEVIWQDFVQNDVELLLTKSEYSEFSALPDTGSASDLQEAQIGYLENLIPDLEEIMLEKALTLKEAMVRERIISLREFFAEDGVKLNQVNQAEELINEGKWVDAAQKMNSLM